MFTCRLYNEFTFFMKLLTTRSGDTWASRRKGTTPGCQRNSTGRSTRFSNALKNHACCSLYRFKQLPTRGNSEIAPFFSSLIFLWNCFLFCLVLRIYIEYNKKNLRISFVSLQWNVMMWKLLKAVETY